MVSLTFSQMYVTHKIARNGELLHLEFQLTQLPKRISFITFENGTEKLPTTLVGKKNSQALTTEFQLISLGINTSRAVPLKSKSAEYITIPVLASLSHCTKNFNISNAAQYWVVLTVLYFHLFTKNRKMYFPNLHRGHLKIIQYYMLTHQTMAVLQQKHGVLNIFGRQELCFCSVWWFCVSQSWCMCLTLRC